MSAIFFTMTSPKPTLVGLKNLENVHIPRLMELNSQNYQSLLTKALHDWQNVHHFFGHAQVVLARTLIQNADDSVKCWSNLYNNKRASKFFKATWFKAGDYTLSQIHRNCVLRKGKAIALISVEIKIARTDEKTPGGELSLRLSITWSNYFFNVWCGITYDWQEVTHWFQHPPQLIWSTLSLLENQFDNGPYHGGHIKHAKPNQETLSDHH